MNAKITETLTAETRLHFYCRTDLRSTQTLLTLWNDDTRRACNDITEMKNGEEKQKHTQHTHKSNFIYDHKKTMASFSPTLTKTHKS
jgi:hypothetical protein